MAHYHLLAQTPPLRQPRTVHLPTELLLEIFLRVTLLHPDPNTLHNLTAVNQEWRVVFKTYEGILWRTAALSAFPGACFSLTSSVSDADSVEDEYWQEKFLIHCGWASRRAVTTVFVVPGPSPLASSPSSSSSSPSDPIGQATVSDTSATAPVVVSIQEATALLRQASGSDSGLGWMSSSHGHQHHHHQHQHHVHDHHLLMNQPHVSLDSMQRGESSTSTNTHGHKQLQLQQQQHACTTTTTATNITRMSPPLLSTDANVPEILSCSLCTYSDVCLIPKARIIVRTYRTRTEGPLMQVLDWAMQHSIDLGPRRRDDREMSVPDANDESDGETETEPVMEEEEGHRELISGMDVNDEGTLLVSCSIDGTVWVWDVLMTEFGEACQRDLKGKGKGSGAKEGLGFLEKVDKFGCPVRARRLLTGHDGWVNAVAVEDTTVVSGGSDHTVRIWDALSGTLLRIIPDLFTTRDLDLGVFSVAIRKLPCSTSTTSESGIVAVGSVIEGYQLFSLTTGDLIMELDEPLTSRQHTEFETEAYQQYAAKVAITETVIVTNSKLKGMLCVWCRNTGDLLYRIRVCPALFGKGGVEKQQRRRKRMVSYSLSESSRIASKSRRVQGDEEEEEEKEEVETIHTFKVNKAGSMLMCTLCDGRVALFEFGRSRKSATETEVVVSMLDCFDSRLRSVSDFGGVTVVGEDGDDDQQHIGHYQEQDHSPESSAAGVATVEATVQDEQEEGEGEDACGGGALAWIWSRDRRGDQRVILV